MAATAQGTPKVRGKGTNVMLRDMLCDRTKMGTRASSIAWKQGKGSRDLGERGWRPWLEPRACARAFGVGGDVESSGSGLGGFPVVFGSSLVELVIVRTCKE